MGRPKGSKNKKTIRREKRLERIAKEEAIENEVQEEESQEPKIVETAKGERVRFEVDDSEEMIEVTFQYLEGEGCRCEFTYAEKSWNLMDGEKYMLPKKVVRWLNSRTVPVKDFTVNPDTGERTVKTIGLRHRFNCIPTI